MMTLTWTWDLCLGHENVTPLCYTHIIDKCELKLGERAMLHNYINSTNKVQRQLFSTFVVPLLLPILLITARILYSSPLPPPPPPPPLLLPLPKQYLLQPEITWEASSFKLMWEWDCFSSGPLAKDSGLGWPPFWIIGTVIVAQNCVFASEAGREARWFPLKYAFCSTRVEKSTN